MDEDVFASEADLSRRAAALERRMRARRSVRAFSSHPVPLNVIEMCVSIAASAPSGANMQPWSFVIVTGADLRRTIRKRSEEVERAFYRERITDEWRKKLESLDLDIRKPFLEEAACLICVFLQRSGLDAEGRRVRHYYPMESVGIATGFLICSLHLLGLSALTYTPQPMAFLSEVLGRPRNERPYMIIAAGYPADGYRPPDLERKGAAEYLTVL